MNYDTQRTTNQALKQLHQSSDLSHQCNSLWKVVIHAFSNTRFKGMQIVNYLAN